MAFYEERFPVDVGYLARGGTKFSTNINENESGFEYRNRNWTQTRGQWTISGSLMTKDKIGTLGYYNMLNFFNAMNGRLHGFRFKDFNDFQASQNSAVIGTGILKGIPQYQLGKKYFIGNASFIKDIYKPVASTFKLYKNFALQTSGYSLDATTGVLSFTPLKTSSCSISASTAGQVTVTANNHGFSSGQTIYFTSSSALVNKKTFSINVVDSNTFTFALTNGSTITANAFLYPQATDNYTCEFEFDIPVRFDIDELNAGMDEAGFISIDNIILVELRLKSYA